MKEPWLVGAWKPVLDRRQNGRADRAVDPQRKSGIINGGHATSSAA
jgi:hypothetical protein